MRFKHILFTVLFLQSALASAQHLTKGSVYAGATGGFATLSGDGSSLITPSSASTTLFDPENGPAAEVFGGIHAFEYVSFQGDYAWNRNDAALVSTSGTPAAPDYFSETESITQNALLGNVVVYFRERRSRVRPFLAEGGGAVLIHSRRTGGAIVRGNPVLPPAASDHASIALRTMVGIDVLAHGPWYLRYTFGETITRNTLGDEVSPPERRIPKNYQNLFGFFVRF